MAYDDAVAHKVRKTLTKYTGITEKKMFGGLTFLLYGNMCCGITGNELMVRVGPQGYEKALSRPHTRKMDFTGKPLKGFVYVSPAGFGTKKDLEEWIEKATGFALSLSPKQ
jgi:TfoX/Sxy family transcriptional regulator of competence genes